MAPRLEKTPDGWAIEPRVALQREGGAGRPGDELDLADRAAIRAVGLLFSRPGGRVETSAGRRTGQAWHVPAPAGDPAPTFVFVSLEWMGAGNRYCFPVSPVLWSGSPAELPRIPPDPPAAPPSERVTFITPRLKGQCEQSMTGFWLDERRRPWSFTRDLRSGVASIRGLGGGHMAWLRPRGPGWVGLVYTEPISGACPGQGSWQPVALRASKDVRRLEGEWRGRKTDDNRCCASDAADGRALSFNRFVGLSFQPFRTGAFIATITVPPVGNQPGGFKMNIRLGWDYAGLGAVRVDVLSWDTTRPDAKTAQSFQGDRGSWEPTLPHGVYVFQAKVFDGRGELIHEDFARAELAR